MILGTDIRLRAIEKEDLPLFVAWLNDPEVTENLSLVIPLSLAAEEKWYQDILQRSPEKRPLAIEIPQGEDWQPIGIVGLEDVDWIIRSAELGIFIGVKSLWQKGYGQKTLNLILQHGFETLNLNRIYLRVFKTNQRGIHAYEKTGFVLEGQLRQAMYRNGRYLDVLIMSVLREEWNNRRTGRE
jgi:diamine N-acetyltransferase